MHLGFLSFFTLYKRRVNRSFSLRSTGNIKLLLSFSSFPEFHFHSASLNRNNTFLNQHVIMISALIKTDEKLLYIFKMCLYHFMCIRGSHDLQNNHGRAQFFGFRDVASQYWVKVRKK